MSEITKPQLRPEICSYTRKSQLALSAVNAYPANVEKMVNS
jgi:hypothetical protein